MEYELVERPYERELAPALVPPRHDQQDGKHAPYWHTVPAPRDCAVVIPEQEWGA